MSSTTSLRPIIFLTVGLCALATFQFSSHFRLPYYERAQHLLDGQIVISAPIQILLYAGDKFLAANIEAMRVAAIGPEDKPSLVAYRLRAHELVSQLNACHEDNYYLANAMLTWSGATDVANAILEQATKCRYWDEYPPLFLGFNQYFFNRDLDSAYKNILAASNRATKNRSGLKAMAASIAAKKFNDEKAAVEYLRGQRDRATDKKLYASLDRRLKRLEGLLTIRNAQKRYEKEFGHPLQHPQELLSSGILKSVPEDPLGVGYEFVDGTFRLRAVIIGGKEIR